MVHIHFKIFLTSTGVGWKSRFIVNDTSFYVGQYCDEWTPAFRFCNPTSQIYWAPLVQQQPHCLNSGNESSSWADFMVNSWNVRGTAWRRVVGQGEAHKYFQSSEVYCPIGSGFVLNCWIGGPSQRVRYTHLRGNHRIDVLQVEWVDFVSEEKDNRSYTSRKEYI